MANSIKFEGSAESKGFAPIEQSTYIPRLKENQQRLLEAEETNFQLKQTYADARQKVDRSNLASLAEFSGTLGKYVTELAEQERKDVEIGQFYDVLLEGFDNSSAGQAEQQAEQVAIAEGERQAEQVSRAANDIEQRTGNPVFGVMARQQFGRLAGGIVGEKALLMRAQSMYGSFMGSWLESNNTFTVMGRQMTVSEAMASGDPALVNAAVVAGRHRFIRDNNLQYATKTQFVNILGPTILSTEGQLSGAAVRSAIKARREEETGRIEGLGYDLARNATASSIDGLFHNVSDQFFHNNTGLTRQQANEAAVKALISGLEDAGNVDALEALLDVPQVPGQAGSELRGRYGNLINDAIERAHDRSDRYDDRAYNEVIDDLEANLNGAASSADRQQLIDSAADELESRGLYRQARELRNNYQQLMVEGGSELNAQEAAEAITNGEITSANQVNRLVTEGKITRDQANNLLRQLEKEDITKNPTFKSTLDQWQDSAEATFLSAIGIKRDPLGGYSVDPLAGDESPLTTGQAAAVVGQMRRDMLAVATMYSRANPGLSDTQLNEGLNRVLTGWIRDNLNSPNGKYRVDDIKQNNVQNEAAVGRIKGYVDSAHLNTPASLRTNQNVKQVDWSPSLRDNGGVTSTVAAQFRASRGDRLFTTQQVKQMREQVIAGQIPQVLKQAADKLGRTPLALLNQQIEAAGMGESFLVNPQFDNTPAQRPAGPAPTSGVSGAQLLMSRFGLPVRGAAWLAGNISTESKWRGQRSWDDVGARAGGLASWRAERLTALEQHFGRPITQIPTNDQLSYLINDLRTNYPNQWRIFNNPNATNRQLLEASYQYWRWGEQGDREQNAVQIEQSLRNGRTSRRQPAPRGGTPQQRAVNVGQQLLAMGTRMWQHPNFDLNNGYVQGGARVGGHSPNSHHYNNSALDIPLSHNNQAQLAKTFEYLRRNMAALGIVELFWDAKGYYRGGRSIGGAGSNAIPGHDTHIHVAFG